MANVRLGMTTNLAADGRATKTKTAFRMSYGVAIDIDAPPAQVWAALTNAAELPKWNSTVKRIEGEIADGQQIRLVATIAPERTFKLKISDVVENERMVWSDGMAPMFRGVRTFELTAGANGTTRFSMVEVFSGVMLPMIAGSLPDFTEAFETYAADLKRASESAAKRRMAV